MSGLAAVVDLGGTWVRTATSGTGGELAGLRRERTNQEQGPNGVIQQIVRMVRESVDQSRVTFDHIDRLVVSSPGPLDPNTGMVYSPPNMRGWGDVPLQERLEFDLGLRVSLVNDASAAALAEFLFGAGRGCRNMVYLTVSTGIGGGIVLDGKLFQGSRGMAGEIGHMTIDRHGPVCNCGNIGCLEALASGTAIARRFAEARDRGEQSSLPPGASAMEIVAGAAAGDALAQKIFTDAAEALGTGIVNVIHVFNPERVVLGGGVTGAGPLLYDVVESVVERHAMPMPRSAVRLLQAELGDDVGLKGAAAVAAVYSEVAI